VAERLDFMGVLAKLIEEKLVAASDMGAVPLIENVNHLR
jgi:hypothetical protein